MAAGLYVPEGADLVLKETGPITAQTIVKAKLRLSHWLQVVLAPPLEIQKDKKETVF